MRRLVPPALLQIRQQRLAERVQVLAVRALVAALEAEHVEVAGFSSSTHTRACSPCACGRSLTGWWPGYAGADSRSLRIRSGTGDVRASDGIRAPSSAPARS